MYRQSIKNECMVTGGKLKEELVMGLFRTSFWV